MKMGHDDDTDSCNGVHKCTRTHHREASWSQVSGLAGRAASFVSLDGYRIASRKSPGGVCGTGFLLAGGSRGWFLKASGVLIEPPSLSTGYLQTRGSGGTGEHRRYV